MSGGPIRGSIKNGCVVLEHVQRPHIAPFEMTWLEWRQLVHSIDNSANLDSDKILAESFGICAACLLPFTEDAWDDRHSDPDGEDVHAECCEVCAGP